MHISKKFLGMVAAVSITTSTVQVQAVDISAMLTNRHNQATLASAVLEVCASHAKSKKNALRLLSIIFSKAFFDYFEHVCRKSTLKLPNNELPHYLIEQGTIFLLAKSIELLCVPCEPLDLTLPSRISLALKGLTTDQIQSLINVSEKKFVALLQIIHLR